MASRFLLDAYPTSSRDGRTRAGQEEMIQSLISTRDRVESRAGGRLGRVVRHFAASEVDGHAGASRSNDRPLLFVNAWLNAGWRSGIVVTLLVGPGDRNALRAEPNHHRPTEAETASRGPLDLHDQPGVAFPAAPRDLRDTGIDPEILADLVLKVAYTAATFTTDTAAARVCLPTHLVAEILEGLKADRLVQILGASGTSGYRFTITERGREHAVRLLEISKYIGQRRSHSRPTPPLWRRSSPASPRFP